MDNTSWPNINYILAIINNVIVKQEPMRLRNRSGQGSNRRGGKRSGGSGSHGNKNCSSKSSSTTGGSDKTTKIKFTAYQDGKRSPTTFNSVKKNIFGQMKKSCNHSYDITNYLETSDKEECRTIPIHAITKSIKKAKQDDYK